MHLGNGIICPVTGIPMLAIAGITAYYAYKKAKTDFTKDKILPTVILTALVFSLQMINFSIPQTGSSGHIIGALLLSVLLGPYIAFLAMCSILLVQSLFFADGGLLALGCNIFNMGFLACFIAYPLLYKPLADKNKPVLGIILASIAALQFGSIGVVLEGALSGSVQTNSIMHFTGLMQAVHLVIGIVEGTVTGIIFSLSKTVNFKKFYSSLGFISLVLAGFICKYASTKPDGLEWSLLNISDSVSMQTQGILYRISELIQSKTAVFNMFPSTAGNITGMITVVILMYLLCVFLNKKVLKS